MEGPTPEASQRHPQEVEDGLELGPSTHGWNLSVQSYVSRTFGIRESSPENANSKLRSHRLVLSSITS